MLLSIRSLIAIAFAASIVAAANAETAAQMRVIDKTFICSTSTVGGVHAFWVYPWGVGSPPGSQNALVGVYVNKDGQLPYVHDHCKATRIRVPLRPGALAGPSAFFSRYSCVFPSQILVRVRVAVTAQHLPARPNDIVWHLDQSQLAVRLYRRSVPIAFATSKATGTKDSSGNERYTTRFWVSSHCDKLGS